MSRYSLAETRRQLLTLPEDLAHVVASLQFPGQRSMAANRVVLCGSGDSRAAARIAAIAARRRGMDIEVVHPWELITGTTTVTAQSTVVLISASGTSDSTVAAARSLRGSPAMTVAVTGTPDSPLARATVTALVWRLSPVPCGPSPAVRTFAATCLALAGFLGLLPNGDGWLIPARGALGAHIEGCLALAPRLVEGPPVPPTFCGTGPHIGAAEFARSKVIETSGLLAVAADPDEWFHVDRHAAPPFGSLSVFTDEAVLPAHIETVVVAAAGQGRQVALVAPAGLSAAAADLVCHLDTSALVAELRPLAGAVLGVGVALRIAEVLGRRPFVNNPG